MTQIRRIRSLKGAGVLADRTAKNTDPEFLRYNLVYGFNGSGKSTLSRIFSCLQSGQLQDGLPEGCDFEFELSDASIIKPPDQLARLQERVCVFNTDFIERNLRWTNGTANSIFYISEEQADAAESLRKAEAAIPALTAALRSAEQSLKDKNLTLATFKRGLAKVIFAKLHIANRKYEAPQLQNDYETMPYDEGSVIDAKKLGEFEEITSRSSPPPTAKKIDAAISTIADVVESARRIASANVGETMVADLATHPAMVPWARTGYEYHTSHELGSCLFCGENLTKERKAILAAAFNDALSQFIADLSRSEGQAKATLNSLEIALQASEALVLMPELKQRLSRATGYLASALVDLRFVFSTIQRVHTVRQSAPTTPIAVELPNAEGLSQLCEKFKEGLGEINELISQHNEAVADFDKHQQIARDSIKRHFLSEGHKEFALNSKFVADAQIAEKQATADIAVMTSQILELRNKVRTHGPAADVITKLVRAYLGHGEISIVAAKQGYELHRHGKLVKGPPSEGEKTALALCYFLSTLEADGRKIRDLIVVVDDPISSLDTKAMNYSCALIRMRLRDAHQLFVMTHNQHCMNEFKKYWKTLAYPRDSKTPATSTFIFLDVKVPTEGASRTATLVAMPKLLRDYDSEYHFLCMKVLEFEKSGMTHSEYGYLMPNVIRRVLELFLSFKVPGTSPIKDKLDALTKLHGGLDKTRMMALERLSQVESHSDSMEDFVAHSSMTIEETRDSNVALLHLMEVADENHTKAIRKQCNAE